MDWQLIGKVLYPETIVLVGILVTLLMSVFDGVKKHTASIASVFMGLASLAAMKSIGLSEPVAILFNSFSHDSMSVFFRVIIYTVTFLIVLGSSSYLKGLESPAEYYPLMMTASLGAGFLAGANDFLVFVVALETLGLSAILLSSYARLNQKSNEAGIKYLISSAMATAILLLGVSFIYGLTSFTNFSNVAMRLYQLNIYGIVSPALLALIILCLVASVAFKLAAAPFHNWSPDVYTGAPTTTTVFLSVVSKAAAFALAIRMFSTIFHNDLVMMAFAVLAVISIVIGNYVGMIQLISRGSAKRMLAYSSIAQAGYLMIGLAVFDKSSIASLILYLAIYAIMNTGAFLALIYFEQITGSDSIYDFAGIIKKRPTMAILFSLCLINLAGLPFIPAGFIAKFFLFSAAFSSGLVYGKWIAVIGLIGSLVALFYYLYFVKIMVVDPPSTAVNALPEGECCTETDPDKDSISLKFATVFSVVLMIGFGVFGMEMLKSISDAAILHIAG